MITPKTKPGNVENEKIISGINPICASSSLSPSTVCSKKNALCGITISTTITRYVATVIKQVNWPITWNKKGSTIYNIILDIIIKTALRFCVQKGIVDTLPNCWRCEKDWAVGLAGAGSAESSTMLVSSMIFSSGSVAVKSKVRLGTSWEP